MIIWQIIMVGIIVDYSGIAGRNGFLLGLEWDNRIINGIIRTIISRRLMVLQHSHLQWDNIPNNMG